jgi:hypothetical protein
VGCVVTQADKQRMLDALLEGVSLEQLGERPYRELEALCLHDLDTLEPIFDDILHRELLAFAKFVVGEVLTEEGLEAVHRKFHRTEVLI